MDPRRVPASDPPDDPPPKSSGGKPGQPSSSLPYMTAETGITLPIAYGTPRLAGNLIERYAYTFASTNVPQVQRNTAYSLGDIKGNVGNLYICTVAGTTASSGDGPTTKTTGITDGSVTWDYVAQGYRHFIAIGLCEGQIYGLGKAWQDKNRYTTYTSIPHDSYLQVALGTSTGDRPGITGGTVFWFPEDTGVAGKRMVYGNTAVLWMYLNTGSSSDLGQIQVEVAGIFGNGFVDANPADIAVDLLTHARRGAAWPSGRVDSVSTGTGNAASWKNYCTATNFLLSWCIDQQTSASDLIKMLLAATNTDAVMTNRTDGLGWMIKFVPLGTDSITANGATYTPNLTPAYSIGIDDLLEPPEVETIPDTDRFNSMPVQYKDRARDYADHVVDDPDMADVDLRGLVRASTTAFPLVMAPDAAIQLSRIKAQRSLRVATKYRLTLPFRFMLVEPTDLLTWGETVIGFSGIPIRVTAVEEDQATGNIVIEGEDFPANVGAAASYLPQTGDGYQPTVSTALQVYQSLPGQVPTNTVPDATSTRGGNVDNLFPNPTSEINSPDGVDATTTEWYGRVNLGAGAFAGDWVRSPGVGSFAPIIYDVAAMPGDTFYLEAQVKAATAGTNKGGFVRIDGVDKTGALLGATDSTNNDTTTWALRSVTKTMQSGTVKARFYLFNGSDASAHAYFDAIYARRAVGGSILGDGTAWFSKVWCASGNVKIGSGSPSISGTEGINLTAGTGGTYNSQGSVRLTWSTPPANFAPGGNVYPIVSAQQVYSHTSPLRLVPVALDSSTPRTWIDLQLFNYSTGSGSPISIATNADSFHVLLLFVQTSSGYSL